MLAGLGGSGGGVRTSIRLRDHRLGSYASFPLNFKPSAFRCPNTLRPTTIPSSSLSFSESPRIVPNPSSLLIRGCQQEVDHVVHSGGLSSMAGGVGALGKFDALHIGHRELAIQASKVGHPFLLSFVGMAEVLGWEPRPPIVAKCDRKRVLSSWAPYCSGMAPAEFQTEFSSVRHLSPREFVQKLAKDLRVSGVVAGENYRFGYKAAGDAAELVRLCEEYGIGAYIIDPVMDKSQCSMKMTSSNPKDIGQVSSTRVRSAFAVGDMKYVSELLGRPHRLVLKETNDEVFYFQKHKISSSISCLLNLAPKEGLYENCYLLVGDLSLPCRVIIDTSNIHIEMGDVCSPSTFGSANLKLLRVEFDSLYS